MINGKTIPKLPGTRKVFHFFKRVTDYVIAMQAITSDSSDHKEFSILTGKFASGEVLPAGFWLTSRTVGESFTWR